MSDRRAILTMDRRHFLAGVGAAAAVGCVARSEAVALVSDPADAVAASASAAWAAGELRSRLEAIGARVTSRANAAEAAGNEYCVVIAGAESALAREMLGGARAQPSSTPESLALAPGTAAGRAATLACGYDPRGLVYALLELADRVSHSDSPTAALRLDRAVVEQPSNAVRSVARLFVSDVEDKPWFNDREMWPQYLTMLAEHRFNRFNLSLGIGYDHLRNVTDAYFLFAYPFLLSVPGYDVRATNFSDEERDRNLETLRFISEETVRRGLEFQLGIWTHGYQWIDSPNPNHVIEGVTPDNHGPYCRDALAALLEACPAISGVTLRIHGESGVAEGNYDFWKTVFDGVTRSGRKVEIDLHAKGIDFEMIDNAVATGLPVKVAPKYWAEHLGMPYHQAGIRELEMPRELPSGDFFAISSGARRFLRYGYGDLMREGRRYGVLHRIWPGTQRLLLWGDPLTAAAYSRAFGFAGSDGVEIMEPLSFKGRRGSGQAGDRCAYADPTLTPKWDWQKYVYSHRVWGRHLYNPDSDPEVWRRFNRARFGEAATPLADALAAASRVLPIITTAHGASAGNNTYWPEVYTNLPIVDPNREHPYGDTPQPKVFGNVSPLDPQLFSTVNEFARELLGDERTSKHSPIEVAVWLEDLARDSGDNLAAAKRAIGDPSQPEFRRAAIDIGVQTGLAGFFATKLRSGVLFSIFEQSGSREALEQALAAYRKARSDWGAIIELTRDVYVADITAGERPHLRGHWADRLAEIEGDIADMDKLLAKAGASDQRAQAAVQEALGQPRREPLAVVHRVPASFSPGAPMALELSAEAGVTLASVRLFYRRVNQAERYQQMLMKASAGGFVAEIPARYTDSVYPLQYYFEVRQPGVRPLLYPGFGQDRVDSPYFVVRAA